MTNTTSRPAPTISLVMIVRDEESQLSRCLDSVARWVDEIVVCDTGSLDRTVEIARSYGAQVVHFAWCDDFAAARNFALSHATGDWVFWLDADEAVDAATAPALRRLAAQPRHEARPRVYELLVRHWHDVRDTTNRVERFVPRLFTRHPHLRWQGAIHEHLSWVAPPPSTESAATVEWLESADVIVDHTGHTLAQRLERSKDERNLRILERAIEAEPDDPYYPFKLAQHYLDMGNAEAALALSQRAAAMGRNRALVRSKGWVHQAYIVWCGAALQLGRPQDAVEAAEQGLARYSRFVVLWYQLATAHLLLGDLDAAEGSFHQAHALRAERQPEGIDIGMTTWRPLHGLGAVAELRGELEQAADYYLDAARQAPQNGEAVLAAARILGRLRRWHDAEQLLCQFLTPRLATPSLLGHEEDAALVLLADAYVAQDPPRTQEAYDALHGVVAACPGLRGARVRLGRLLCDAGEYQATVEELAPALDDPTAPADLYDCLANALRMLGREDDGALAEQVALARRRAPSPT